ncbi:hypothetical protein QL285_046381 [Trifolium repens]|nr:hypothetical protein QL285_046381 [Trifolium repens]
MSSTSNKGSDATISSQNNTSNINQKNVEFLKQSWANMTELEDNLDDIPLHRHPWCFLGDFNTILEAQEHSGFAVPSRQPIVDFQDWTDTNFLIHLPTTGAYLTWSNGRRGARHTERRLDRAICNQDWMDACTTLGCSTLDQLLVDEVIPNLVSDSVNVLLTMLPSYEEIKNAVFSLNKDSALGPDGYDSIDQFRPIAMANFKFKIISKVLADRLAKIMPTLISKELRGFIQGRNIKDCICLTSEAINLLHKKSFGGSLHEFFNCTRGVRQGDPLSPLLFCLAEEVLSRGISKLVTDGNIELIKGARNTFVPSHCLYADDIMVFCSGKISSLNALKNLFVRYANCSGQVINAAKSTIYSGGISQTRLDSIVNIFGFKVEALPFNYLGVPIFKGRPKASYFYPISDKIKNRLSAWKASLLSIAGRV